MICNRHKRYKAGNRPSRDCVTCWNGFFIHNPKYIQQTKDLINLHGILPVEAIAGTLYMKHFFRVINVEAA